jgi:hypothetical protein
MGRTSAAGACRPGRQTRAVHVPLPPPRRLIGKPVTQVRAARDLQPDR